jgi:hypothetical protein
MGGGSLLAQIMTVLPIYSEKLERDIYEEFFDHQMTDCAIWYVFIEEKRRSTETGISFYSSSLLSMFSTPLPSAPSLISIGIFAEKLHLALVRALPTQTSLTREDLRSVFREEFLVLGKFESDEDGVLKFVDTTGSILIQLSEPVSEERKKERKRNFRKGMTETERYRII